MDFQGPCPDILTQWVSSEARETDAASLGPTLNLKTPTELSFSKFDLWPATSASPGSLLEM